MRTKTIGEILKEERTAHRLSLEELSKRTRIRVEYLKALEANKFNKLPAATFVKGYIKSYARVFTLDFEPLIALLRRDFKESAKGKLVPREFLKPVLKKQRYLRPVTIFLFTLIAVFLVLAGYIGFQWYNFNRPPELIVISPQEDEFVSSQVVVEGKTNIEAILTVNASPVAIKSDGTFKTEVYLPREGIATITVEASDRRGKSSMVQRTIYVRF